MSYDSDQLGENLILDIFSQTGQDDLNYFYRGTFTQRITENILALAERNFEGSEEPAVIRKRVYYIMVESLQNITRYQSVSEPATANSACFVIQKMGSHYFITTGNVIDNDRIPYVNEQLERVNSLNESELKEQYRTVLKNGQFTRQGGAGLGLIEITRKSRNRLSWFFRPLENQLSYFYLHTVISPGRLGQTFSSEEIDASLRQLMKRHLAMNADHISLIFNSGFNQDTLLSLLSMIESQLRHEGFYRKRFFHVMVEMIQNIIHHASDYKARTSLKPGIFYIQEMEGEYYLNASNYVDEKHFNSFYDRLGSINVMDSDELNDTYNSRLFDFSQVTSPHGGLGILDIRIKSGGRLDYSFEPVGEGQYFFTLKVSLEKIFSD